MAGRARYVVTLAVSVAVLFAVVGLLLRDRVPVLAILSYMPVIPVTLVGIAWDAICRGRAWGRLRFGLVMTSLIVGSWFVLSMVGWQTPSATESPAYRIVQWNVRWGGADGAPSPGYEHVVRDVVATRPGVLLLSEAPRPQRLPVLIDALGDDWSWAMIEHKPGDRYFHRLVVCARWPVQKTGRWMLDGGVAMACVVAMPEGSLRVLMVDGDSSPLRDRRRLLAQVTALVREAADAGQPYHLLAGDFNTPGRSIGFEPLTSHGFENAAAYSGAWRATWPAWAPMLDLDHIWLDPAHIRLTRTQMTRSPWLDHRGIVMEIEPFAPQAGLR